MQISMVCYGSLRQEPSLVSLVSHCLLSLVPLSTPNSYPCTFKVIVYTWSMICRVASLFLFLILQIPLQSLFFFSCIGLVYGLSHTLVVYFNFCRVWSGCEALCLLHCSHSGTIVDRGSSVRHLLPPTGSATRSTNICNGESGCLYYNNYFELELPPVCTVYIVFSRSRVSVAV